MPSSKMLNWPACLAAAALILACAGPAAADIFQDGVAAEVRGDHAEALRLFGEAAAAGQPQAQFALAEMYRTGEGTPADQAQALAWYRKAADQGNPGGEYALAQAYLTGKGAPRNDHTALDWLQKAALHGYTPAQLDLGRRYVHGQGVPRDDTLAMEWLQKAADDGDPDGANELAQIATRVGHTPKQLFSAMMDRVFGPGHWRETGGFRTRAQEDALRKAGAGTVRLGEISRHSMGNAEGPGAYDVVVMGMSPVKAALKLKRSGEPLQRVVCEQLHGEQGPHLHVEPKLTSEYVSAVKPSSRRSKRARA